MIKLKYILLEGGGEYKKEISLENAVAIFKKNNKGYKDYRKSIYRGTDSAALYYFAQPSQRVRQSAYTSNYYTLIIDNSPEWAGYPKRSQSLICTTDPNYAKNYSPDGESYYHIFPKDGSNIGVCPTGDIWRSFEKSMQDDDLTSINYCIEILADDYLKNTNDKNTYNNFEQNYDDLQVLFSYVTENKERIISKFEHTQGAAAEIIMRWNDRDYYTKSFGEYINSLLNPKQNKFKLVKYDSGFNIEFGHEVWTDADSLLVNNNVIKKFKKAVGIF